MVEHRVRRIHRWVSIHDVWPETLGDVARLVELCAAEGVGPLTLLVSPGRAWRAADLDRLRRWADAGHELAAHGWSHRARAVRGVRHRLHSALMSADAAEHLALEPSEVPELMRRSAAWFADRGFGVPRLYVPPAWALGPLRDGDLTRLPYEQVEVTTGLLGRDGVLRRVPLVGYEAQRSWQAPALRRWNRLQRDRARTTGVLRLALHPGDLRLPLAHELRADLAAARGAGVRVASIGRPAGMGAPKPWGGGGPEGGGSSRFGVERGERARRPAPAGAAGA